MPGYYRFSVIFAGTKKGPEGPFFNDLQTSSETCRSLFGAGNETRTRDPDLGKVVLYQLSYSRVVMGAILAISKTASTP
jgi:hypothetical protein